MWKKHLPTILVISIGLNLLLLFMAFKLPSGRELLNQSRYPYLSKRIFAEAPNDILINFTPLRNDLRIYTEKVSTPLGIYFEYLPSGTSIGINEKDPYFGASLLKIPVAMKVYHLIEEGKLKEDQEFVLKENHRDKGFGDLWQKEVGTKLRLSEVTKLSISQSDNTADKILREAIGDRPVSDVFDYLDIPTDVSAGPGAGVSPKSYASILRSLYLSAYLSIENSNKVLEIMTTSPYTDRLVAGVPKEVKVAHKVGIYKNPQNEQDQVHSDCGIIYLPKRPYLLCVMSKSNREDATKQIAEISKKVYQFVVNVN